MSIEENKAIARRVNDEVWGNGNLAAVDELFSPDYVDHNPIGKMPPNREGIKQAVTMFRKAFANMQVTTEDIVAEGDKVMSRFKSSGTHSGDLMGIAPTGKQITTEGINIIRIVDGKIVEDWTEIDMLGMMQQLGVAPMPE
jgi:predicted ester cyclase